MPLIYRLAMGRGGRKKYTSSDWIGKELVLSI